MRRNLAYWVSWDTVKYAVNLNTINIDNTFFDSMKYNILSNTSLTEFQILIDQVV